MALEEAHEWGWGSSMLRFALSKLCGVVEIGPTDARVMKVCMTACACNDGLVFAVF